MAAPASADSLNCVSRDEFPVVQPGWSKARVHRLFDIPGTRHSLSDGAETRKYSACWTERVEDGTAPLTVRYGYQSSDRTWRVVSKTNPNCASPAEFEAMRVATSASSGMSMEEVGELFDTSGWILGGHEESTEATYQQCGVDYGYYHVWYVETYFNNGDVFIEATSKSGPFIEPGGIWQHVY
jgi:hypothetical protein